MGKTVEMAGGLWDSHTEVIICPKCGSEQIADVVHTVPFWIRVHDCTKCKYTIMESEWERCFTVIPAEAIVQQTYYEFDYLDSAVILKNGDRIRVNGLDMIVGWTEPIKGGQRVNAQLI